MQAGIFVDFFFCKFVLIFICRKPTDQFFYRMYLKHGSDFIVDLYCMRYNAVL